MHGRKRMVVATVVTFFLYQILQCIGHALSLIHILPLKSAKEVALMTNTAITSLLYGDTYVQIPGGDDPQKVQVMGTNNSFWRLFSFSFVEGQPFSEEEFQSCLLYTSSVSCG